MLDRISCIHHAASPDTCWQYDRKCLGKDCPDYVSDEDFMEYIK